MRVRSSTAACASRGVPAPPPRYSSRRDSSTASARDGASLTARRARSEGRGVRRRRRRRLGRPPGAGRRVARPARRGGGELLQRLRQRARVAGGTGELHAQGEGAPRAGGDGGDALEGVLGVGGLAPRQVGGGGAEAVLRLLVRVGGERLQPREERRCCQRAPPRARGRRRGSAARTRRRGPRPERVELAGRVVEEAEALLEHGGAPQPEHALLVAGRRESDAPAEGARRSPGGRAASLAARSSSSRAWASAGSRVMIPRSGPSPSPPRRARRDRGQLAEDLQAGALALGPARRRRRGRRRSGPGRRWPAPGRASRQAAPEFRRSRPPRRGRPAPRRPQLLVAAEEEVGEVVGDAPVGRGRQAPARELGPEQRLGVGCRGRSGRAGAGGGRRRAPGSRRSSRREASARSSAAMACPSRPTRSRSSARRSWARARSRGGERRRASGELGVAVLLDRQVGLLDERVVVGAEVRLRVGPGRSGSTAVTAAPRGRRCRRARAATRLARRRSALPTLE